MWKKTTVLAASILACLVLSLDACDEDLGDDLPSLADERAPAGDTTSCQFAHQNDPRMATIVCEGTFAACAAIGCQIQPTEVVFYPDHSWRSPDAEESAWWLGPGTPATGPTIYVGSQEWGWVGEVL